MILREVAVSGCTRAQVAAVVALLADGATVPFIARYRKEATGSLDEVAIRAIEGARERVTVREARREVVRASLESRDLLTAELADRLAAAPTLAAIEDLYAPFRPKRKTRASVAVAAGLAPLAQAILEDAVADPAELQREADRFVDASGEVLSADAALAGAGDILAEWIAEHPDVRSAVRDLFVRQAELRSAKRRGVAAEGPAAHFRDYFEHHESAVRAPSHRILAVCRGEAEGHLSVTVRPASATVEDVVTALVLRRRVDWRHLGAGFPSAVARSNGTEGSGSVTTSGTAYGAACAPLMLQALRDGCERLLVPSLESEYRGSLKRRADEQAIAVFARNLDELLMAPPLSDTAILAIDPGLRTGCKVVCLDRRGELLASATIFPLPPVSRTDEAASTVRALVQRHGIEAVAVGNGTGGREAQAFIDGVGLGIPVVPVSESGASVYSASDLAREEFPEHDVTVRGAISIGRRLADPLSELVKIDPKSIGVGQYQHDVDQKLLRKALDEVVLSCVNRVGVDLNSAGWPLLAYVSGVGPKLARAIVQRRVACGGFAGRAELLSVPGLGPKAFEQCAGFLRIRGGAEPLDAGAVHPERYSLVRTMAADVGVTVIDLMHDAATRGRVNLDRYVGAEVGLPTLRDIMVELEKPGRDPRGLFEPVRFADVHSMTDLTTGMKLPGVVTNIAAFGAFVDIGVHQDGLVHISKLADRFVRDPHEVVSIGAVVTVTVVEVDVARKRISLSMV
ncbi:MAG: RNA-binding transcriptional accessory protein [Spirochaetaceae bacterium]|nr:MAG: RNA-binding transcriptional accessory protein [Spirochaetaceae bacterium]